MPAGAYLLDLDTMTENARLMSAEAARLGLDLLAMTKQIGRNPPALDALRAGGVDRFVAVDMACAPPPDPRAARAARSPTGATVLAPMGQESTFFCGIRRD